MTKDAVFTHCVALDRCSVSGKLAERSDGALWEIS